MHGVVGGLKSVAMGGKFKHGFSGAFFGKLATPGVVGTFEHSFTRIVVAGVIGGAASVLAGGEFNHGFWPAAFGMAFNELNTNHAANTYTRSVTFKGKSYTVRYVRCPAGSCGGDNYDRSDPQTMEYLDAVADAGNQQLLEAGGYLAAGALMAAPTGPFAALAAKLGNLSAAFRAFFFGDVGGVVGVGSQLSVRHALSVDAAAISNANRIRISTGAGVVADEVWNDSSK